MIHAPLAALVLLASPPSPVTHGIDLAGRDTSVQPGDDFDRYCSGSWYKATEIPADRSSWGPDEALAEEVSKRLAELLESAAKGGGKVGDYFASFMDEAGIEAKGLGPLKPELARLAAIPDKSKLAGVLGGQLRADVDPLNETNFFTENFFGLWVGPGLDHPERRTPYLLQGGLGLPDREYYLAPAEKMADIRKKYQAHVAAVLKLAGLSDVDAKATRIVELETRIAKVHVSRADSEDVLKANNPWARADFARKAPGMDWAAFFAGAGLEGQGTLVVWHPSAVTGMAALIDATPLQTWKDYLTFHLVNHFSFVLPKAFVDESFGFYGKTLAGTPKLRERTKRAVAATNEALRDAVGQLYVARYFPPKAKEKAQAMVANIVAAFTHRIDGLAWMSAQTKARAKEKLGTLYVGIGYPEKWRDYTAFEVARGDALGNAQRAELFDYRRNVAVLGGPVDTHEWAMPAQIVNAVNLPLQNALNFPAAILQRPFFDEDAEPALNYGAMGAVIGHEISHSFDDQGSQFDAHGKLVNWWTPDDLKHFQASGARLVAQYSAYKPFPDLSLNGQLTLSENIADVAGLSASHDAWVASLGGKPAPVAQGLSGEQQFFLSFGQSWREKVREPALRQRILTDGHAPGPWRAATVRNVDAWYSAFGVKAGQRLALAPADRVQVW